MKFDFVIGNPPYQDKTFGDNKSYAPPVYDKFIDAAQMVADKVELIHPARFLFDAGGTPKAWNEKMLNDPHFKVLHYEQDSSKIFGNTDIKGGVVISYRDAEKDFGAIKIFTKYPELNSILYKVKNRMMGAMSDIIQSSLCFQPSKKLRDEHPELPDRFRSSLFSIFDKVFFDSPNKDGYEYVGIYGLSGSKRVIKYIRRDYITDSSGTLDKYTLLMPKASGSGLFGEQAGPTVINSPGVGYSQTFISIGSFDDDEKPKNIQKYIKTKFARTMLSILKITQDCPGPKWIYVPVQDFSCGKEIAWNVSISNIDKQLYKKYDLSQSEIDFIEHNVKEMA